VLLVHSKEMKTFDDLFAEYMKNPGLVEGASKAGAAALLIESTRLRGLLYRHPLTFDSSLAPIPSAIVSREHAERIARLAAMGPVRMRLKLTNRTGGPYQANNVVAQIRGREKPDEVVLIGAHLDSWDLGTGAEDNGVNAAMVLDVARGFQQLGVRPRRTIRFVLFTGEEQGMWGSAGYVARHREELSNHVAVVVFDTGSGHASGFFLNGREELRKPVNDALSAVAGVGATAHVMDALDGTDNFDFLLSGVPNLVAIQDPAPYLPDYHAESDTFDRSNLEEQKVTEAVASTLVYGLAEMAERPAARQSRRDVEQLIERTKLDQQMKLFGQWEAWRSGKRGLF
jgi:carboxypeptidase Q